MMRQRSMCSAIALALCLAATGQPSPARAARTERFSPGAPGVGDPYFPLDGNGGFDVEHYRLELRYDPELDDLRGVATIRARATQNLSSFNLDLDGLEVSSVVVNGSTAAWSHEDGELRIAAERGLPDGMAFEVAIAYGGVPRRDEGGASGFVHTEDGAVVAGQPHVAATWFPANDHPSDTAAFTFEVTVPEGLEVVANGALADQRTSEGWTTWRWEASAPMATYLAGMSIGDLDIRAYEHAGVRYWDAIPTRYLERVAPPAGDRFLISQLASESYERVTRVISVPPERSQRCHTVRTRSIDEPWRIASRASPRSGRVMPPSRRPVSSFTHASVSREAHASAWPKLEMIVPESSHGLGEVRGLARRWSGSTFRVAELEASDGALLRAPDSGAAVISFLLAERGGPAECRLDPNVRSRLPRVPRRISFLPAGVAGWTAFDPRRPLSAGVPRVRPGDAPDGARRAGGVASPARAEAHVRQRAHAQPRARPGRRVLRARRALAAPL